MTYLKKIAIIASLICYSTALSQRHFDPNIAFGAKGGMTISRSSFSPSVTQSMTKGALMGVTFRYMEEKNFGVIIELNMEQRGWKENFEGAPFNYERTFTYMQIPMLTHIYFGNTKFRGFFNLGPEIGLMIGDKSKSNFDVNNIKAIPNFPAKRQTAQFTLPVNSIFDYGISAGLGCEYIIKGKNSIMLEGRFYYGLGNVFSSHKADIFSASSGMSIMVSLGYMYRIK
ncbi:MAG: porin family protein [Muribaculaceae bacterium]